MSGRTSDKLAFTTQVGRVLGLLAIERKIHPSTNSTTQTNELIIRSISRIIGDCLTIGHSVPKYEVAVVVPTPSGGAKRNVFVHPFGATSNDLGGRRFHRGY